MKYIVVIPEQTVEVEADNMREALIQAVAELAHLYGEAAPSEHCIAVLAAQQPGTEAD